MPRTREQFHEMKDERVASILDAALHLFAINGSKVSIDAISEKAKCSHGIVYHYFKNTEQIYEKLLKSPLFLDLNEKLLGPKEGSSYERIEEIISILVDVSAKDKNKICYLLMIIKNEEKKSLSETFKRVIKEGQNSGKIIGGEPSDIVNSIFFLLRGIYLTLLIEKHPTIKVPSLENVMQLIRKPLVF